MQIQANVLRNAEAVIAGRSNANLSDDQKRHMLVRTASGSEKVILCTISRTSGFITGSLVCVAGLQIMTESLAGQDPHIFEKLQDTELLQRYGEQTALHWVTVQCQMSWPLLAASAKFVVGLPCISRWRNHPRPARIC